MTYYGENGYLDLLQDIMLKGVRRGDRTGTGTIGVFGPQIRFDLKDGFPLLTTKKVFFKGIVHELLWFLRGDTNTAYLKQHGVTIWDEWADEFGDLGPIYGAQWRDFGGESLGSGEGVDQIVEAIERLKKDPNSRRHIVCAWNPLALAQINKSPPPCHALFQFYVANGRLSCQLYQRSADMFLGVPFNIASYALLTHMVAQVCGLEVDEFIHTFGDAHIYLNHVDQVQEQLSRRIRPTPSLVLNKNVTDIFKFEFADIVVTGYDPWPAIKAPISI